MGESYYSPQTDYIGHRPLTRENASKPPEAQTYAERFATNPIYGSAYGLPYDQNSSVFNQPMASTRASRRTPSRASSLTRDSSAGRDGYGSYGSSGSRSGARRRSLFDDDDDDFKLSKPIKKYSLGSSEYDPIKSSDLRSRIKKMGEDFGKSIAYDTAPPRGTERTETTWKTNINSKGQPIVQRQDITYTSPVSGSTYRRSSVAELPYESSTRTRRSSIGGGEESNTTTTSTRTRKYSESSSSNYGRPPRPQRTSLEESSSSRFTSAQSMRDARKLKDSEELSESINKMVNKMRSHHLDDADADIRSISRTVRAASLDPFEDDGPRSRSRQRARLNQFTYGVSKRN